MAKKVKKVPEDPVIILTKVEIKNLKNFVKGKQGHFKITQSGASGIGTTTVIHDLETGENKNVTDYDCW